MAILIHLYPIRVRETLDVLLARGFSINLIVYMCSCDHNFGRLNLGGDGVAL